MHLPYHESDHVLNLAYNVLCGGTRLEDIERLRHDTAYMNALGADLIPDPTTAGDFCRRFAAQDVIWRYCQMLWMGGERIRRFQAAFFISPSTKGTPSMTWVMSL